MATSLTTAADQTALQAELKQAAADAQNEIEIAANAISNLGDISINQNFDYNPVSLGSFFRTDINALNDYLPGWGLDNNSNIKYSVSSGSDNFTAASRQTAGNVPSVSITNLSKATVPSDAPNAPSLATVVAPTLNTVSAPGDAPTLENPDVVDAPTLALPDDPTLTPVVIPDLYDLVIPSYEGEVPTVPDTFASPSSEAFDFDGGPIDYTDDELEAMASLLLDDLQNGGYGVNHVDEEAIFQREIDRETTAATAAEDELFDSFASRGFPLPTGTIVDAVAQLQQQTLNKISEINREVSIQRAELVRQYRQSAQENTLGLGQLRSTYRGFAYERLLKAKQFAATFEIQAMQAAIDIYNLRINLFNTESQKFRDLLEAERAQLERNRTVLERAAAQQQVNEAEIAIYNARASVLQIEAQIFNTKVAAAKTKSDIEVAKLDAYRTQVQAFTARLEAEGQKIENYNAQLQGQRAQVDIYQSEVAAFGTEVQAKSVEQSINNAVFEAAVKERELELEQHREKVRLYEIELQQQKDYYALRIDQFGAQAGASNARTNAYQTRLEANVAEANFIAQDAERDLNWLSKEAQLEIDARNNEIQTETELLQAKITALGVISRAYASTISHLDVSTS